MPRKSRKSVKAAPASTPAPARDVKWFPHSDRRFTMRGLWWYEENKRSFCRLPHRAKGVVRDPVWDLAQCPAGARLCFRSDTTLMRIRCTLRGVVPFAHMPATGHSSVAVYAGGPYRQQPMSIAFPDATATQFERDLFSGLSRRMREYTLYLPPYNAPTALEIGLSPGARIEKPSAFAVRKPAVFYGTSITQGGCVHTAGAEYQSILGRMLNLDTINLGFSGNGRGEPEVARFIAEIDASLYALDYVANVDVETLRTTLPVFVQILRDAHPTTPIVLMSKIVYMSCTYSAAVRKDHETRRDVMISFYSDARRAGDGHIHFVDGNALLPYGAHLAHCDGGHPTSVGFQMMAEMLAPQVAGILLADE